MKFVVYLLILTDEDGDTFIFFYYATKILNYDLSMIFLLNAINCSASFKMNTGVCSMYCNANDVVDCSFESDSRSASYFPPVVMLNYVTNKACKNDNFNASIL